MKEKLQADLPFGDEQNNLAGETISLSGFVYRIVSMVIRSLLRLNGGLEVNGRDNIPAKGGVIIASNHISYLDPPAIAAVLPRRGTFIARKGLFSLPLLGWFIKHYAFPIDRERTQPSTIKDTVRRLKNNELIVIFPEGKMSESGELQEGKRGIGMIAGLSKAVVVPALISGTNRVLPAGARFIKRSRVSIVFGGPIYPSTALDDDDQDITEKMGQRIMHAIGELKKNYEDHSS